MNIYYFGYIKDYGHGWQTPGSTNYSCINWREEGLLPWDGYIDGKFCPKDSKIYQEEGKCLMRLKHHNEKSWTLCSFWDRSGDKRPGSNSAFLVDQPVSFNEMMELVRKHFPKQIERMEKHFTLELKTWV